MELRSETTSNSKVCIFLLFHIDFYFTLKMGGTNEVKKRKSGYMDIKSKKSHILQTKKQQNKKSHILNLLTTIAIISFTNYKHLSDK